MKSLKSYFKGDFDLEKGASSEELKDFGKKTNFIFPTDYLEFMQFSNGGEGDVGENSYLILWSLSELPEINIDFSNSSLYPIFFSKYFFFGRSAGPTLYAFNKQDGSIFEIPEIGIDEKVIKVIATTFTEFIKYLYSQN